MLPQKIFGVKKRVEQSTTLPASRKGPKNKTARVHVKAGSSEEAENICEGIRRICTLSPLDIDLLTIQAWTSVVSIARRLAYPDRLADSDPLVARIEKMGEAAMRQGEWRISASIIFFDETTMRQKLSPVHLWISHLLLEHEIPEPVPRFVYKVVGQEAAMAELGENVVQKGVALMQYIQSRLTGRIASHAQVKGYIKMFMAPFVSRSAPNAETAVGNALERVKARFLQDQYPTMQTRVELANELGVTLNHIEKIFRSERARRRLEFLSLLYVAADTENPQTTILLLKDKESIGETGAELRIPTSSHAIAHVVGAFLSTMEVPTGNLISAWASACKEADYVREQARTSTPAEFLRDMCSDEEAHQVRHSCHSCYSMTTCAYLFTNLEGARICTKCAKSNKTKTVSAKTVSAKTVSETRKKVPKIGKKSAKKTRKKVPRTGKTSAPSSLKRQGFTTGLVGDIYRETSYLAVAKESNEAVVRAAETRRKGSEGNWTWIDAYIDAERRPPPEHRMTGMASAQRVGAGELSEYRQPRFKDLFGVSFDPVFPVYLHESRIRLHVTPNIVPTAYYVNLLKGGYPPIVLQLLFLLHNSIDSQERENLLLRFDQLYYITLQLPVSRKKRLQLQLTDQEYDMLMQQFRTGVADPKSCTNIRHRDAWKFKHQSRRLDTATSSWDGQETPNLERVKTIIAEMEQRWGKSLPTINGVPYPFACGPRPTNWSWKVWYGIFSGYLRVLTAVCNRLFETTCTVDTLILTYCWQILNPESAFKGLLNVNVSLYSRHPLALSIGKRAHGFPMNSGWKADYTCLDDFDEGECNLAFEPWLCNDAKQNVDYQADDIVPDFMNLRRDNAPFWSEILADLPPLPEISTDTEDVQEGGVTNERDDEGDWLVDGDADLIGITSEAHTEGDSEDEDDSVAGSEESAENTSGDISDNASGKEIEARTRSATPNRRNLTNIGNTCYASSEIQAFHNIPQLEALVQDQLITNPNLHTGRHFAVFEDDPGLARHITAMIALRGVLAELDKPGPQLSPDFTSKIFDAMRAYRPNEYKPGEANDTADFLDHLLQILAVTGDKSSPSHGDYQNPQALADDQAGKIKSGVSIDTLESEARRQWNAYLREGHDSKITELLGVQVATESKCPSQDCPSPISRSWQHTESMVLDIPRNAPPQQSFPIETLLNSWKSGYLNGEGARCMYDRDHPRRTQIPRRFVRLPALLVIRINRRGIDERGQQQILLNPLELPESLDLAPWSTQYPLCSERGQDVFTWDSETGYELRGFVQYIHQMKHYVLYCKISTGDGNTNWAVFDDMVPSPKWENPFLNRQPGRCEYVLFYTRVEPTDLESVVQGDVMDVDSPSRETKRQLPIRKDRPFMYHAEEDDDDISFFDEDERGLGKERSRTQVEEEGLFIQEEEPRLLTPVERHKVRPRDESFSKPAVVEAERRRLQQASQDAQKAIRNEAEYAVPKEQDQLDRQTLENRVENLEQTLKERDRELTTLRERNLDQDKERQKHPKLVKLPSAQSATLEGHLAAQGEAIERREAELAQRELLLKQAQRNLEQDQESLKQRAAIQLTREQRLTNRALAQMEKEANLTDRQEALNENLRELDEQKRLVEQSTVEVADGLEALMAKEKNQESQEKALRRREERLLAMENQEEAPLRDRLRSVIQGMTVVDAAALLRDAAELLHELLTKKTLPAPKSAAPPHRTQELEVRAAKGAVGTSAQTSEQTSSAVEGAVHTPVQPSTTVEAPKHSIAVKTPIEPSVVAAKETAPRQSTTPPTKKRWRPAGATAADSGRPSYSATSNPRKPPTIRESAGTPRPATRQETLARAKTPGLPQVVSGRPVSTTAAAATRPKTPGHPDTTPGRPAPGTREEVHTGDRRRYGHISPSRRSPAPSPTPGSTRRSVRQRRSKEELKAKKR